MRLLIVISLLIFPNSILFAQSSFQLSGQTGLSQNSFSSLNSFESNPSSYSNLKDWGFSFSYGSEFASNVTNNLYQISAGRTIGDHYLSIRYTPGYQKEFNFKSGEALILNNSESISLTSKYTYKELFGLGYSYKLNPKFSIGFSTRFFKQDFVNETVTPVFSDTIYFISGSETDNADYWRIDLGFVWHPIRNLALNLSSINLLTAINNVDNEDNTKFKLKSERALLAGLNYSPAQQLNLFLNYESNSSFQTGFTTGFNLGENHIGFAASVLHDKYQNPFIAGIVPGILFSSNLFDASLNWIKYFSDRKSSASFKDFSETGLNNIINNRFSYDKILLTVNFKLNTKIEQKVKFIDVKINKNIYPALGENYINIPFATAKVVNLTDKKLSVKPAVVIQGINDEKIQSPVISIFPQDTSDIDFYTIIPDSYSNVKPEISFANFYLFVDSDEPNDEFQNAILINGINAWDGNVRNLKYFIQRDQNFALNFSKKVISENKSTLDTVINALSDFYKAKIIYNSFSKHLTYTADPRASAEYVQFPRETIELKGGDCDDLSVCYSALLESIGIETALIDYKSDNSVRHVSVMFNTRLSPQSAYLITENDTKYFIRKNETGIDELWIPVETTELSNFENSWSIGAEKFHNEALNNLGLIKGNIELIDIY